MQRPVHTSKSSECNTQLKADIIDSVHSVRAVSICGVAVISCQLETEICALEREPGETDLWRDVEAPVVMSADEGRHICTLA